MAGLGVFRQYLAAFVGSLSVMVAGTSYGWITPILVPLLGNDSEIPMTADQSSWIISFVELGDLFSPLPAGYLVDTWGRKTLLLYTAPMYIVSWVLVLATRSVSVLYLVRIVQGFAMGVIYTVLPMYLGEISQPSLRGSISTFFEGMWCIGILFEYCIGPYVSYQTLAYVSLSVPIVFLVSFIFMPESPYYLIMVDKISDAEKSLNWLRGEDQTICVELQEIKESVENEMKNNLSSWRDLFATSVDTRIFIIVQLVTLTKFMSGIAAVLSYASQTFSATSVSFLTADQFTIAMGILILLSTLIATLTVDKMGRRPLLLISSVGCAVFELLASVYYYFDEKTDVDLSGFGWVAFATISAYCVIFSLGIGPLVPTLQGELFPSNTRGLGSGITTITDTVTSLICMKLYQVVSDSIGIYLNYLIYAMFSMFGAIVIYFIVPETKGKSLAQIQADLKSEFSENQHFVLQDGYQSKRYT